VRGKINPVFENSIFTVTSVAGILRANLAKYAIQGVSFLAFGIPECCYFC
jgi:hypothetical protein